MMNKKFRAIIAAVLASTMLLTACGGGGKTEKPATPATPATPTTQTAADSTTLNVASWSDIVSLDPIYAYDHVTNPVVNQITEGLLNYDENAQIVCNLAKSWKVVDPTTYVYVVRDDVKFSDGTPMTMEDVMFSIERYRDPALASYLLWMYASVDTIEQTGDWEITVKLKQPDALWPYTWATTAGHIISKAYYEAHSTDFGKPTGGVMGTGAYKFDSWETGSQIKLSKNPNYWNKETPATFEKIVYTIIPEDTTRLTAITTGQVDFAIDPPIDMIDQIKASPNVTVDMIDSYGIDFLSFNCEKAPFNDVNVRKAIAHTLNKQALYDSVIKDSGQPATAIPMGSALYTVERPTWESYKPKVADYEYNMDLAKEALAKSAYPNGFECKLMVNESSINNSIALMIQQSCAELGIKVTIEKISNDELINVQFGGKMNGNIKDYDMGLFRWESDFPDPSGNLVPIYLGANKAPGGSNVSGYDNPAVNELLDKQAASTDPVERTKLMQQAIDIISEDVPVAFTTYPRKTIVMNKRLEPYKLNAAWIWNLYFKGFKPVA
ncbi:MAG: ABC transporter substrate-binding protein [Oscillospiraceae bacterium]